MLGSIPSNPRITTRPFGTGLGLAIVKHIVFAHGGNAWVKSELGHGAVFYFTLPRSEGETDPEIEDESSSSDPSSR